MTALAVTYLASDSDVWGEGWVVIPTVILTIILLLGVAFLGPREESLGGEAMRMEPRQYDLAFGHIKRVTWILMVLVVAATFVMTALIPS